MTDDETDWRELREFKAVDLTKSFVLSWHTDSDSLLIDLDLYLCPEHAFYEKPRPAEKACFRAAHLEFPNCSRVASGADAEDKQSVANIIPSLRNGSIDSFLRTGEGRYRMTGEFGEIEIHAERPLLKLKGQIA